MYEESFCIKRIKELMDKNGFNLYRLSKQSGISLSTLSSMFQKNTDPRVDTIERICAACGISVTQFFEQSSKDLTDEQSKILALYNALPSDKKRMAYSYLRFLQEND